jgi:Ca-activated chloride channel family protein
VCGGDITPPHIHHIVFIIDRSGSMFDTLHSAKYEVKCAIERLHPAQDVHVIMLSDGMANRGETEPEALGKLAGDLAARGVTSSCVGIGHNYSPLQLNAIAEAGEGEMHHSSLPEEIVEVVMGELGEVSQLVARNFSITLQLPYAIKARQLTRYRTRPVDGHYEYYLGNLVGGQQRRLAFLVDLPEIDSPQSLAIKCTANWLDVDTAMEEHSLHKDIEIRVVPVQSYNESERDKNVARIIADIWMARHGYDAMMLNEQGLYEEAARIFDHDDERFARLITGLEEAKEMKILREKQREYSTSSWVGESKLEAMSMSRKTMRSKPDFRRQRSESKWTDFKPD